MTISRVEFNTKTETAEIWNYFLNDADKAIIKSEMMMSCPVAPWADRHAISGAMISLALDGNRWEFGR